MLRRFAGSLRGGIEPETITYKNRVEADGGEIIDLAYVDSVYKKIKEFGLLSDLEHFTSAMAGLKKDVNNAVSKMYSLNGIDVIQNTVSKQPVLDLETINYDGTGFLLTETPIIISHNDPYTLITTFRPFIQGGSYIINLIGSEGQTRRNMTYLGTGGNTSFQQNRIGIIDRNNANLQYKNSFSLVNNQEYKLAIVYKANGLYEVYIDGILDTTWQLTDSIENTLAFSSIGIFSEGVGRIWRNSIKGTSIYHESLTQQQIAELNAL